MHSVTSILVALAVVSQAPLLGTDPATSMEDLDAYHAATAKAGKIPDAHVRLALWCEARGMIAARDSHLAESLKLNPSHVKARGLLGQVREEGRWLRPEEVVTRAGADPKLAAKLDAYDRERDLVGDSADDHLALGVWCGKQGLMAESRAHYAATVRRDPARPGAWKKLGYKLRDGRWVSDSETTRARRQFTEAKEAYHFWATRLARLRSGLDSPQRRDAIEAELNTVHDPLATPSVWATFVGRGPMHDVLATRLFAQIDGPEAASRLALLAVIFTDSDVGVREKAIEALALRDPREYIGSVISLLRDPMRIETRPIRGPGLPGAIIVDGVVVREYHEPLLEQFLAPAGRPFIETPSAIDPTTVAYGLTCLTPGRTYSVTSYPNDPAVVRAFQQAMSNPAGAPQLLAAAAASAKPPPPTHVNVPGRRFGIDPHEAREEREREREREEERARQEERARRDAEERYKDAVKQVHKQFQVDQRSLEEYNREIERGTHGAAVLLQKVTGRDHGRDREAWSRWWADWNATEDVAPSGRELAAAALVGPPDPRVKARFHRSRLAAETCVWTTRGRRPVEAVRLGDRLLSQDPSTGALAYTAVVAITGGARVDAIRITLEDGGALVLSPMARVWRAGHGWGAGFRLEVGDQIRTLGGRARIAAVDQIGAVAGYNVLLYEGGTLFAGDSAILVHDNGIVQPPSKPFDAPPVFAQRPVATPR